MTFKTQQSPFLCSVRGARRGFFLWFLCSLQVLLFGQEEVTPEPEQLDPEPALVIPEEKQTGATENREGTYSEEADTSNAIFYIRVIDFNVTGWSLTGISRPFALMYHGEFKEGEELKGKEKFEKYIKDKIQLLKNQRTLKDESVKIDYTFGDTEADGRIPVDLLVSVEDTWNVIALPYPKFDSNTGFELTIKARDYNFLGTLSPLRVDLGYEYKDNTIDPVKNVFKFAIDSDIPFQLFGFRWNLNFDNTFNLTMSGEDKTFYYKNVTGISVEFPFRETTLTVGLEENATLHEENPAQYREKYGEYAGLYFSSAASASWKIPMGIMIYEFGELTYTPSISGQLNYRLSGELEPWRKGPTASFSHSLGFGRINWLENYRSGLEASTRFGYAYNVYTKVWDNSYSFSVTWHKPFTSFFGISTRFQFRQWFFDEFSDEFSKEIFGESSVFYPPPRSTAVGDTMRGIMDNSIIARNFDYMLSLNLDFPFQVLRFAPSQWFQTQKLRFFDFDLHVSLFIDMALLQGWSEVEWESNGQVKSKKDISFAPKDMLFTGGIEFIAFPKFMRSLYIRASFGYNLNKLVETGEFSKWYGDELFIGIGHHY